MSNSKKWALGAVAAAATVGLFYVVYSQLNSSSSFSSSSSSSYATTQQPAQPQQQQKQKHQRASEPAVSSATPVTPTPRTPSSASPALSGSEPTTPTNSHPVSSPQHWTSRAKQATAAKDTQGAIAAWTRAIELDGSGSAARHKYFNNRANQFLLLGRADAAQQDAEESLRIQPADNAGAHYALGRSLKKQERYAEAQVQFERAIAEGAKGQILTQVERELSDVRKKAAAQPAATAAASKSATSAASAAPVSSTTPAPSASSAAPPRPLVAPAFVSSVAPPSMRRQDTEQDLLAHEQSEDDAEQPASHTFPTNKPPVSFANVVSSAETAHQQELEQFPALAEQHTYPAHPQPKPAASAAQPTFAPAAAAPLVPAPVVVNVQPGPGYHGSFAEVAAKAAREEEKKAAEEEQSRKAEEEQQAVRDREQQARRERARQEEEEQERSQAAERERAKAEHAGSGKASKAESAEERRTRERIERTEAADAVRVRQVSGAEEQLLRALSPSAVASGSSSTSSSSSSSFFSLQPSDELTDSGVLVDRPVEQHGDEDSGAADDFPSPSASRSHKAQQQQQPAPAASGPRQPAARPVVSVTAGAPSWASMAKSLSSEGSGSAPVSLPSSAPSSPKQQQQPAPNGTDAAHVPAASLAQPVGTAQPAASPAASPAAAPSASGTPPSPQLPPLADRASSAMPPPAPKQPAELSSSHTQAGNSHNGPAAAKQTGKSIKPSSPSMSPLLSPASPSSSPFPVDSAAVHKLPSVSKSPRQPKKSPTADSAALGAVPATGSLSNPTSPSTSHSSTPSASPKLPPRSQPNLSGPAPVDPPAASPVKAAGGKSWAAMAAGSKK